MAVTVRRSDHEIQMSSDGRSNQLFNDPMSSDADYDRLQSGYEEGAHMQPSPSHQQDSPSEDSSEKSGTVK
jgi:hypothetical protein